MSKLYTSLNDIERCIVIVFTIIVASVLYPIPGYFKFISNNFLLTFIIEAVAYLIIFYYSFKAWGYIKDHIKDRQNPGPLIKVLKNIYSRNKTELRTPGKKTAYSVVIFFLALIIFSLYGVLSFNEQLKNCLFTSALIILTFYAKTLMAGKNPENK